MQVTSDHRFATLEDARAFALAGNAILTLQSLKTGLHFTYRVRQAKDKQTQQPTPGLYFVSLLANGSPDGENNYRYLGMIRDGEFRLTRASGAGESAPSVKAFRFFWGSSELHEALVVRHEGRCGRCARTLTVPESIDRGIGPDCAQQMGVSL
jgi:hypothetical protein